MTLKNEEKDKRSRLYLFIIIVALFVVNGILIYNLINNEKKIVEVEEKNENLTSEVNRLDAELDEMVLQLDEYRGKNMQLDSIIAARDKVISNKISQIRGMLKDKNVTKEQINQAEMEIRALNGRISRYRAQVDSLSKQNKYLVDEVYLRDQEINRQIEEKEKLNTDLDAAKAKIRIGSILKIKSIRAEGVRFKGSKTEKVVTKLSKTDKVRIWFTLDNNEIAEPGNRLCYLKIITPSKSTLHNEERGSGKFTYQGEESLYTAKQAFTFRNQNEEITFYWDKSPAMISGDYEAYIFCEDAIIGKTEFTLR
jgi:hypothetical protein